MSSRPAGPTDRPDKTAAAAPPSQVNSLDATLDAASQPSFDGGGNGLAMAKVSQRLGRFLLLRELGAGGMGTVYVAYDEQLDRKVAVKLLHPREIEQSTQRQRVLREAQAMARVSHPNVVHIYEVGEIGSHIFMAMEYVDGTTLAEWQKQGKRPWREILAIYRQAGKGLLAAHQTGLVHRDFKPENVLVDRGGLARVADFGLARLQGEAAPEPSSPGERSPSPVLHSPLTATGTLSGTPGYMSPEQFRLEKADSRSDQFSFCVALFEAMYKQRPFGGDSIAEVSTEVLDGKLRRPPANSPVPIEIAKALSRGLARDPSARFPTMAELLEALDVDGERDPAGAAKARKSFSLALSIITFVLGSSAFLKREPHALTMAQLTLIMAIVVVAFSSAIAIFHESLLGNAFHRGLTLLTLVNTTTLLLMRATVWYLGIPILQYYPVDILGLAGCCAAVSLLYLPRLWYVPPAIAAGALACTRWPQHGHIFANIVYTLVPIVFIYGWNLVATLPKRDGK